jgi:hypothetical protein
MTRKALSRRIIGVQVPSGTGAGVPTLPVAAVEINRTAQCPHYRYALEQSAEAVRTVRGDLVDLVHAEDRGLALPCRSQEFISQELWGKLWGL